MSFYFTFMQNVFEILTDFCIARRLEETQSEHGRQSGAASLKSKCLSELDARYSIRIFLACDAFPLCDLECSLLLVL